MVVDYSCGNCENFHNCDFQPRKSDILLCGGDFFEPKSFNRYKLEVNGEILFLNFKPMGGRVVFWADNTLVIDGRVSYLIPYTEFRKHFYMQQAPRKRLFDLILDLLKINDDDKDQVALIQDRLNEIYTELGIDLDALEEEDKNQTTTDRLISLATEKCVLFKDQFNDGFAGIQNGEDNESLAVYPIKSKFFKQWLSYEYYKLTAKAPNSESLNSAFNVLLGQAVFKGERIHLYNRVAGDEKKIYYDLAWDDWRIVEITRDGWSLIPHSIPIFRRYTHQLPQVKPVDAGVESFKKLLDVTETLKNLKVKGIDGIKRVIIRNEPNEGYVIYSEGSNLEKVLDIEGVDPYRTTTNDIQAVGRVLGIEAARNMIIKEAYNTLMEQGLNVDLRHIMLVADIMTVDGTIRAIGRHGVSKEKESVLSRAAFEITVSHLLQAARRGEVDKLGGVAENIIVGQPVNLGTGAVQLVMKRNKKK